MAHQHSQYTHHEVLQEVHSSLVMYLQPLAVIDPLLERNIIGKSYAERYKRIERDKGPTACSEAILELLQRDPSEDNFWKFLDILLQTKQQKLFNDLNELFRAKAVQTLTGKQVTSFSEFGLIKLQQSLKTLYRSDAYSQVPLRAWVEKDFIHIDRIFINLEIQQRSEYRRVRTVGQFKHYKEIFSRDKNRYTVCGDPGSGKSTLSQKIVYDWATENEYSLKEYYDLILMIRLREINKDISIPEYLLACLPSCDLSTEGLGFIFDHHKTLLLFDGLDEIQANVDPNKVIKIIKGETWKSSHVHILVTLRPHALSIVLDIPSAAENLFNIMPFDRKDFLKYIEVYFHNLTQEEIATVKENITDLVNKTKIWHLVNVPYCTLLVCFVYETFNQENLTLPDKASELYSKVVAAFGALYEKKNGIKLPEEYLHSLRQLACEMLLSKEGGKLIFTEDEVKKYIDPSKACSVGLLVRQPTYTGKVTSIFKGVNYFAFMHKSIQDYLGAEYLVECDDRDIPNDFITAVNRYTALQNAYIQEDLFQQFVAQLSYEKGHLNKAVIELIVQTESNFVTRTSGNDEILGQTLSTYAEDLCSLLLKSTLETTKVSTLYLHNNYWLPVIVSKLTSNVIVNHLLICSHIDLENKTLYEIIETLVSANQKIKYISLANNSVTNIASLFADAKMHNIEHMILASCELSDQDLLKLLPSIENWKDLKILDISDNYIGKNFPAADKSFSLDKETSLALEKLNMSRCKSPAWIVEILVPIIKASGNLKSLNLSDNHINASALINILQNIYNWPKIECINFSGTPCDSTDMPQELPALSSHQQTTLALQELNMSGCRAPLCIIELLLPVLSVAGNLRSLNLCRNNISIDVFMNIIKNTYRWPHLQNIDLSFNPCENSSEPKELPDMSIYEHIIPELEELNMSGCRAPQWIMQLLVPVIKAATNLKMLNLNQNSGNDSLLLKVLQNISKWSHIKCIDLSKNICNNTDKPQELPDMLIYEYMQLELEELDFSGCRAPLWIMELLIPVIKAASTLKTLKLNQNSGNVTFLCNVLQSIHKWPCIKYIDLSLNHCDNVNRPPEVPYMSAFEHSTMELEEFKMSGCMAPPWIMELLIPVIKKASHLKTLDLFQNHGNETFMLNLFESIHKCPHIKYIDLSYNLCDNTDKPQELPDMLVYEHMQLELEELDLSGCRAPLWIMELLIPVIKAASNLKTLTLSQNSGNVTFLCNVLQSMHKWPRIKYIDLSLNHCDNVNRPPELPDMSAFEHSTLELEEFKMSGCMAPQWIMELLIPVIKKANHLKTLNLFQNHGNETFMLNLFQNIHKCPRINYIDLSHNLCDNADKPQELPDMLVYEPMQLELEELDLTGCRAPLWIMELLIPVIKAASNLKMLKLNQNSGNVTFLCNVLQSMHKWPRIKYIDLSLNHCDNIKRPPELPDMSAFEHSTLELEEFKMSGCMAPPWIMELLIPVIKKASHLKTLDLFQNHGNETFMLNLFQNIHKCPRINYIDLSHNLCDNTVKPQELPDMLAYEHMQLELEELDLTGCRAPLWIMELLIPVIKAASNLRTLKLNQNSGNVTFLCNVLQSIHKWPRIKYIDLSLNYCDNVNRPPKLPYMSAFEHSTMELEKFKLSGCKAPQWIMELLIPVIKKASHLKTLDLFQNHGNETFMLNLFQNIHKCPRIKYIDLSYNLCDNTDKPKELPDMLIYEHMQLELVELDLSGCRAPLWIMELLIPVIKAASNLKTLKLNQNSGNVTFLCNVLQSMHKWPRIKYIDLSLNHCDNVNRPPELPDMSAFEHLTLELEEFKMSGCKAPQWIMELLIPVIKAASNLKTLKLNQNSGNVTFLCNVLQSMHKWPRIKYIDLSLNHCDNVNRPPELPDMSAFEHSTLELEEFKMFGCKAPQWIIELLIPVIKAASNLKMLKLNQNSGNVTFLCNVLQSMHKWPRIKYIDLSLNHCDNVNRPPELPDMSAFEHLTLELEEFKMSGCKAPQWIMELLIPVIKAASNLKTLKLNQNSGNVTFLCNVLQSMHKWPRIKYIDLSLNHCDNVNRPPELPDMSAFEHSTLELEEFKMFGCKAPQWIMELLIPVIKAASNLKMLKLNQNSGNVTFLCNVLQSMHKWPRIKYIDLSLNHCDNVNRPPELPDMSAFEHSTLELEEFKMSGCRAPQWIMELLIPVIKAAGNLKTLKLNHNSGNATFLLNMFQNLYKLPRIKYIDLRNNICDNIKRPEELPDMSTYKHMTMELQELDMFECRAPLWISDLVLPVIKVSGNLRLLNLSKNSISANIMMDIIQNLYKWPQLQYINLSNNPCESTIRPIVLPDMLVYEQIKLSLEEIDISNCHAPLWIIELLVPAIKVSSNLKLLDLARSHISASVLMHIIQYIHKWPQVKYINISENICINTKKPSELPDMSMFEHMQLVLEKLNMSGCRTPVWISELLVPVVKAGNKLESLNIEMSGPTIVAVINSLTPKIKYLSLSNCNLTTTDMNAVIERLPSWTQLKKLDMSNNRQSDTKVWEKLLNNIPTSIEHLDLGKCNLQTGDMFAVIDILPSWKQLRSLYLCDNPQSDSCVWEHLIQILPKCRQLNCVHIQDCQVSAELQNKMRPHVYINSN